ncbi:MAG TPA: DNA ligase D [Candidatus Limnocylindria bacterium]|nr:DNA ligase D [Candidatus Limnocylindria bacterium]
MPLETYRSKRDFGKTPEPSGAIPVETSGRFVVQRHRATRLHYDLRLEINGVLASWAVPRGPTLDPDERRLAMKTEDHPIEYLEFEALIPKGQYGAGDMIVWDWGTYEPEETDDPAAAVAAGELKFRLHGERVRGRFTLVKTRGRTDEQGRTEGGDPWLLIHKRDEYAEDGFDAETQPRSVKTGRTNDELAAGQEPRFEAPPPAPEEPIDLSAAREAPLPEFTPPMLATAGEHPYEDASWLHEVKWDGYRVQAVVRDGTVKLWTRNRADGASYFPELAAPPTWIDAVQAVVDGEVVALGPDGRPSFSALQERTGLMGLESRTGRRRPRPRSDGTAPPERSSPAPIIYQAFDLLYLDGLSLLDVPLESRKRLLHRVLEPHPLVLFARHVVGEGTAFLDAALAGGLEGVVAKKRMSRYRPGERSPDWVKVKIKAEQDVAVIGWLPRQGSHDDLGSLIVAVMGPDGLVHAGQVGSGLGGRIRRELLDAFAESGRSDPPVAGAPAVPGARWVEPRIVARVEFAEWTHDGLLRQPTFLGIPVDRDVSSTIRQDPPVRARRLTPTASPKPPGSAPGASQVELAALDALEGEGSWEIGGQVVRLTNLDKILFPARDGDPGPLTKRDLARYYTSVGAALIPHLRHHGLTLQRFPDGVERKGFWQKDLPSHTPAWITRRELTDSEGTKQYVVVDRVATLAWLAQEAAIELHPWTATIEAPDRPRFALIDIDPGEATTWEEVLVLARLFRAALDHLGVIGLPKTTGKRGIQVWVPIADRYTFDQTRDWVEGLSRAVGQTVPDLVSWAWTKRDRRGRARLDYTQNAPIRTLVAPYSVRPSPGAPVSTPITWDELEDPELGPERWTIRTLPARLDEVGDLFASGTTLRQELPPLG